MILRKGSSKMKQFTIRKNKPAIDNRTNGFRNLEYENYYIQEEKIWIATRWQ